MERLSSTPVVDQMRVRGPYEHQTTDTAQLAGELSAPQDILRLTADFDDGTTSLRDVGGMIAIQRTAILEAYQARTIGNIARTHPDILTTPVANLHERVVAGHQDQPVGHNFFVNATGFLDARLPWARQFDELLRARSGVSLYEVAQSDDKTGKDRLLAAITADPDTELLTTLAVYLAGRSQEGEKFLKRHFGETLEQAKGEVYETTQRIAATTGLRIDMLERVAGQLNRATFGSFDHLQGLVTSDNSGAAGDYHIGSLRVEVQFDGNVQSARLRTGSDAHHVIVHELQHAGSAQTQENYRCGLQINGQGLEANEGMTEYLAQLAIGSPGIERVAGDTLRIRQDVPYRAPVFAMLALHEQFKTGRNNHFANLFNAYHGDVRSQEQLEQALDAFYQHNATIARHLAD